MPKQRACVCVVCTLVALCGFNGWDLSFWVLKRSLVSPQCFNFDLLCSSGITVRALFSSTSMNPQLHMFRQDARRTTEAPTLWTPQLAASRKHPLQTNKAMHSAWDGRNAASDFPRRSQPLCTPNPIHSKQTGCFHCLMTLMLFLWLMRIITVAAFYLWSKAITPGTYSCSRLCMLENRHYLSWL